MKFDFLVEWAFGLEVKISWSHTGVWNWIFQTKSILLHFCWREDAVPLLHLPSLPLLRETEIFCDISDLLELEIGKWEASIETKAWEKSLEHKLNRDKPYPCLVMCLFLSWMMYVMMVWIVAPQNIQNAHPPPIPSTYGCDLSQKWIIKVTWARWLGDALSLIEGVLTRGSREHRERHDSPGKTEAASGQCSHKLRDSQSHQRLVEVRKNSHPQPANGAWIPWCLDFESLVPRKYRGMHLHCHHPPTLGSFAVGH